MPFIRDQPYNDLPSLPPAGMELETRAVLKQTIAAARALADLRGVSAKVPNPRILINGIVLQEARLSSEIENIVTTSDELSAPRPAVKARRTGAPRRCCATAKHCGTDLSRWRIGRSAPISRLRS